MLFQTLMKQVEKVEFALDIENFKVDQNYLKSIQFQKENNYLKS